MVSYIFQGGDNMLKIALIVIGVLLAVAATAVLVLCIIAGKMYDEEVEHFYKNHPME